MPSTAFAARMRTLCSIRDRFAVWTIPSPCAGSFPAFQALPV